MEEQFAQYSWISFLNVQFKHWMQRCKNVASSVGFENLLNFTYHFSAIHFWHKFMSLKEYAGRPFFRLVYMLFVDISGELWSEEDLSCAWHHYTNIRHMLHMLAGDYTRPQRFSTFRDCRE